MVVSGFAGGARKALGSYDRQVPLETTLAAAQSLRARYGITRIADTTRLDRIGIPTISAIVPNSPDGLGVYNGKGLVREAALAGALMEAIERQVCARFEGVATFSAPLREVDAAVDLRALGWLGAIEDASARARIACVRGESLLDGSAVALPLWVVRHPRIGKRRFYYTSTNGLASGNTVLEAVYHALMELIERHLWSRAHVLAHIWPRALRTQAGVAVEVPDDPIACDVTDAAEHPLLREPIARIRGAGLRFRLLAYTEPEWPVAMLACVSEPAGGELFYHLGFGCSWSPVHAAIRAVTEAVQVRVTDIQGAREDIRRAGDGTPNGFEHGRRPAGLPTGGRWYFDGPAGAVTLAALPDRSDPDLARDLERVVKTLGGWGETCMAAVDLTPPGLPIAVVRVVASHLERTLVDGTISASLRAFVRDPVAARGSGSRNN